MISRVDRLDALHQIGWAQSLGVGVLERAFDAHQLAALELLDTGRVDQRHTAAVAVVLLDGGITQHPGVLELGVVERADQPVVVRVVGETGLAVRSVNVRRGNKPSCPSVVIPGSAPGSTELLAVLSGVGVAAGVSTTDGLATVCSTGASTGAVWVA